MSRPHVVVHVAVSLDGATTGFDADVARFYELAGTWQEDVTLCGADTILAQEEALRVAPRPGPAVDGPLLAVVDGRGRVSEWEALRECGHWSDVLALRGAGGRRVDLTAALDDLAERRGARGPRRQRRRAQRGAAASRPGRRAEPARAPHPRGSGPTVARCRAATESLAGAARLRGAGAGPRLAPIPLSALAGCGDLDRCYLLPSRSSTAARAAGVH